MIVRQLIQNLTQLNVNKPTLGLLQSPLENIIYRFIKYYCIFKDQLISLHIYTRD